MVLAPLYKSLNYRKHIKVVLSFTIITSFTYNFQILHTPAYAVPSISTAYHRDESASYRLNGSHAEPWSLPWPRFTAV